ncbi:MAG TPA: L-threonylcarbamoyladenylate synthase [Gaiellaceae bacterium]|nr:L-threonylcarbamoyladenylate synthase [Gaiellaceae bacterium]
MEIEGNIDRVIAAVQAGLPVLLPTDTVYGLVASANREEYATRVYRVKGRQETKPTALLASSLESLFECVPELRGRSDVIARALLPGPFTLILPNPARRFRWLTGVRTDAIGVRVPELPDASRRVVDAAGCLMATSANDPGGPNPVTLDDVPQRIRDAVAAELDLGPLPGTPSTVIDFTNDEPFVIREGIVPAADAIARVQSALAA